MPKLSEPVSPSDEFRPSNKPQGTPFTVFVDQTLRSSDNFIWSRNMCSFWKANHHRQHLETDGKRKSKKTEECDKIQISNFEKGQSLVPLENFKEKYFPTHGEVDIDCHGSEMRKVEENSEYFSSGKEEGSVARNYEQNPEVEHTIQTKFRETQHSEITPKDKENRNTSTDSKSVSVHKSEVIEPYHILEEFTVLKGLSNVVPDGPIEKLPEDHSGMKANTKLSIAEAIKPELNGMAPLRHITCPGEGTPKEPAIAKPSLQKRKGALHNSSSVNILAHQEHDRHKMKPYRNKLDSKTKNSNRTPQNFMISIESSMKPPIHKTSKTPQVFPALGLVNSRPWQSPKFQRRMPQIEKKQSTYRALKPKTQSFPCICKNPEIKKSSIPLPLPQTEPGLNYLDLKYSDMFKEIDSTASGPGIYEMFGTPVYCHMREAGRHENKYYREICSAPLGRCITNKCRSSHSERCNNNRTRLSQKRTHAKTPKTLFGIKQKHKSLVFQEKGSKTVGSNLQDIDNGGGISEVEWQVTSSGHDFLSSKDEVQPMNSAQMHEHSIEQNEFLHASDLSIVEEVSMEESADEGDISNNQILAASLKDWHELEEVHHQMYLSGNSWVVPSEKSSNKHVLQEKHNTASLGKINANQILTNDVEFNSVSDESKTLMSFSFQEKQGSASSQARSLDYNSLANKTITHQTFGKTLNDANLISQEILDSIKYEELTDELLGCLAAELLALDEKDNNSCEIMAHETDPENLNLVFSRRGNTMQELGRETRNAKIQVGIIRIRDSLG